MMPQTPRVPGLHRPDRPDEMGALRQQLAELTRRLEVLEQQEPEPELEELSRTLLQQFWGVIEALAYQKRQLEQLHSYNQRLYQTMGHTLGRLEQTATRALQTHWWQWATLLVSTCSLLLHLLPKTDS